MSFEDIAPLNEVERLRIENACCHEEIERLRAALREIIADSFSVYAIEVARAALEDRT